MESLHEEPFRNVIVIGASAGGFSSIGQVLSQLPGNIDAAVFVVIHLSEISNAENIIRFYQKNTTLKCKAATDNTVIDRGHVYLAPPNFHMLVHDGFITINQGARENKYRPSIDVLFRSAAVHYGSRVIGIILSGMLDDGTSGMSAIKRCGGICMVQEPSEAEFPNMPQSVINQIPVDYTLPLKKIGEQLKNILSEPLPSKISIPYELKIESEISEKMMISINHLKEIGDHTVLTCPECGGELWAMRNEPVPRFRCYTGHVYTANTLYEAQQFNLEESVWVSIRMLEEKRNLLSLLATDAEKSDNQKLATDYKGRADEMSIHAEKMKILLSKLTSEVPVTKQQK